MTRKKTHEPAKRKRGRPTTYTPALGLNICEGLIAGKPLDRILRRKGMPAPRTVLEWLDRHSEFTRNYARARAMWAQIEATGIIRLADTATAKNANAVRVKVDTRKWVIAKLLPKVYGDRLELDATLPSGADLRDANSALGPARRIAFILGRAAMAHAENVRAKRLRLPAPVPEPVYRDPQASADVRAAHPGASTPTEIEINPRERDSSGAGDGERRFFNPNASAHEQGRDEE